MTKKVKFEEAFQRLEEIARLLEQGEISLDESLELFEEGMKLIDLCNDKLNEAEKKISKLTRSADGTLQSEPWDDSVSE